MKRSPAFVCHRLLCSTVVALLVAGCGDGVVSLRDSLATVRVDSVTTPAGNVLVRRVFATLTRADSAWVEVTGSADPLQRTPSIRPVDGTNEFLVAGLRQAESYSIRVVSRSRAGARLESGAISTATDSLPVPLRTVRYTVTGAPSTGYTLFPINVSGRGYIVAFDAAGTVRWYFDADAAIPTAPVAAITQLRTGGFLAYVGFTSGWQPVAGRYFRIGLDGAVVSGISAPTPFYTDSHEIIPLYTGDSLSGSILFGYDLRTTDMTAFGGPSNTLLAGHYIFRQSLSGATDFWWNSWDHLRIDGWIEEPAIMRTWPQIDYAHPNAMAVDHDGNYLVSWRHLAEITKINSRTGAIMWRWGGRYNQIAMVGDTLGFFSGQHSIQVLANGNYLLFDNGLRHSPQESRAVEYRLDPIARTATLVWQFRNTPLLYSQFTGSVQRLENGNTLICWAWIGRVSEVTMSGQVISEGVLTNGAILGTYRATRIRSLYAAGPI